VAATAAAITSSAPSQSRRPSADAPAATAAANPIHHTSGLPTARISRMWPSATLA
jgi:hypothetical protein